MNVDIPAPVSGGVILSYKCNAECLHFTGGEPFLNFELLCRAVELADGFGIPSTFVETNCFWCVSDAQTREKLALLKGKMSLEEYIKGEGAGNLFRNAEFFLSGRAAFRLAKKMVGFFPRKPANVCFRESCLPVFLRGWHNHFDGEGNYIPGFCGGVALGDGRRIIDLVREGIEIGDYPILRFMIGDDFEGLYQFACERGYAGQPEGYLSKCHLCIDIRRHLSKTGAYGELKPAEFYRHLD